MIDKKELLELLKDNLRVAVRTDFVSNDGGFFTEVSIYFEDDIITSDSEWTYLPIGDNNK